MLQCCPTVIRILTTSLYMFVKFQDFLLQNVLSWFKHFDVFLMIRRPPRSTLDRSSAASDVYKRQVHDPGFRRLDRGGDQVLRRGSDL